jgi:hypothetical protein
MAEPGGGAVAGGGSPSATSVIDGEIGFTRQELSEIKQAIRAIYAAREAMPPQVLRRYLSKDEQDKTLDELKEKDKILSGMLRDLITQRAKAQSQAGEGV